VVVIARPGAERLDYASVRDEIRGADRALARAVGQARAAADSAPPGGKGPRP
jgi:hypothetical protein